MLGRSVPKKLARLVRSLSTTRGADAKIVCAEQAFETLCAARGHTVVTSRSGTKMAQDELLAALKDAEALVVRSGTRVDAALLDEALSLRIVGRAGAGLDNVDVDAATAHRVLVMNAPSAPTVSVAEMVLSLLHAVVHRSTLHHMRAREGLLGEAVPQDEARPPEATVEDLRGKTVGIIGLGRIGREVAALCHAAGMHVVGYDPILSEEVTRAAHIEQMPLDKLYRSTDVISVHTPLTVDTRHMIDAATLSACKPGVVLLNCARGGIIDEAALLDGLRGGRVGGVGLDVYSQEPPGESLTQLLNHPLVVCTPHVGASTGEAQAKVAQELAARMCEALAGQRIRGAVNAPAMGAHVQRDVLPYVRLAEVLGSLHAQLVRGRLRRIEMYVRGARLAQGDASALLSRAVLKGLLGHVLEEDVNLTNAAALAEELGLHASETRELEWTGRSPSGAFVAPTVRVVLHSDDGSRTLTGAVHEDGRGRLVEVDGMHVDVVPEGEMVFFRNEDRPGIIKDVTALLLAEGVNIASFEVGRKERPTPRHGTPATGAKSAAATDNTTPTAAAAPHSGGDHSPRTPGLALGVLTVDDPIPDRCVRRMAALPHLRNVRVATVPRAAAWDEEGAADADASPHGAAAAPLHPDTRPTARPASMLFGSGPTKKRPGWSLQALQGALVGRSHRGRQGKARLELAINETARLLELPADYLVGIVPGSDTGAFEIAMWSLLGPRPVDVCYWDAFGKGWADDIQNQLRLGDVRVFSAEYGWLPELGETSPAHDVCFTWNGTTSGVKVPDHQWISEAREGLTLCDATSAVFAMDMPWPKLDVTTFSWQKVLGGEGAHGMLILSPRAVERLEAYRPAWPMPKLFRMTDKNGKLNASIFAGSTINTPSMLCVEDYVDALEWADRAGGLPALVKRSMDNLQVVQSFVGSADWCSFLARDPATVSNTSVCLELRGADAPKLKRMTAALEAEGVAVDIGSYRDAPPGLRLWCGATVEKEDLEALMPWLAWAYDVVSR